jgi:Tfp pilus assembly protein PilX
MRRFLAARRANGAVLVTALVLLLIVLMIGAAAARASGNAEKSARHERDRHIAFLAADAALADAERDIEGGAGTPPGRAALFAGGAAGFSGDCGRGADDLGLCLAGGAGPAAWEATELAGDDAVTVGYGSFTGAQMPTANGSLPARKPRYLIEFVPVTGASATSGSFYRITAIGFGARDGTRVVLQSFYRKAPAVAPPAPGAGNAAQDGHGPPAATSPPPPAALPSGRIAWREVANWPELHQAAVK